MAQCKGTLLLNLRAFVEKRRGAPVWRRLVEAQRPADRAVFEGLLLPAGWYPVGVWNRALTTYLTEHAPEPPREMLEIARFVADRDLNTLFKVLLRMGSPEFVLKRTDSLWTRYFDAGTFMHEQAGPRFFRLALEAPKGEDLAPSEWTCNQGVCGWITQALHLTGARQGAVIHTACRFHNAARCEYEARW